ncbi:hypothetical protein HPB47_023416 [Ixodes persulcatus]|uniref:Uncharacterized protein n=1 Tax=Ixodes persulcatus TaxID=34615 RepID=A0AC60Q703_IXOPE|nr:hypothetical protein HPB47_023416 [Ixodes persulcatus]
MPSEITPSPRYRLNLKVVIMSILIWAGTFVVFAAISVTLAITTNAMYFLFIIMGLVVSTFAMAFYKPEGPWEPLVPYSKLCDPKLETHAPIYVEEKSSIYPPSPSIKSVTRSDPWLCTSAKTTLRGSFSSPRLSHHSTLNATWPSAPPRDRASHLPAGFLPLVPTGVSRSLSSVRVSSPANCEELKASACHQSYGCYESRVIRTNYKEWPIESCASNVADCLEADATSAADADLLANPLSSTITMTDVSKDAPAEKKRRRLLWNIFGRSNDKPLERELSVDASECDDTEPKDTFLTNDGATKSKAQNKATGIANLPEYQKVVENIEKTIREAKSVLNSPKERQCGDGATKQAMDVQPLKQSRHKGKQSPRINEGSPETHGLRGILNSTDSIVSDVTGIPPFWKDGQSPEAAVSHTRSSRHSTSPSAASSASRLTSGASTPRGPDHRYLNEAFFKTHSSWDDANPESTTPFQKRSASKASTSHDILCKSDLQLSPDETRIWGAPSQNKTKVGDKASQTSLRQFYTQFCGDDLDPFRMPPLVKADLVEVTVINNAPPDSGGIQQKLASPETGDKKPPASKYVQATSKTVEASVQMGREVVTCDGDNNSPSKKSKRRKLKLLPRFLRGKKKK